MASAAASVGARSAAARVPAGAGRGGHDGGYAFPDPHRTRSTFPGFIPATCHHLWAASWRASAGTNQVFLPKWWDVSVMEGKSLRPCRTLDVPPFHFPSQLRATILVRFFKWWHVSDVDLGTRSRRDCAVAIQTLEPSETTTFGSPGIMKSGQLK